MTKLRDVRSFWRICVRWMVHLWLGLPLLGGVAALSTHTSEYADIAKMAQTKPKVVHYGTLAYGDVRHRTMKITTKTHSIYVGCGMSQNRTHCLHGYKLPAFVAIKIFKYQSSWMIINIYDVKHAKYIFNDEPDLVFYKNASEMYSKDTPLSSFIFGSMLGGLLIPFAMLFSALKRWLSSRERSSSGELR